VVIGVYLVVTSAARAATVGPESEPVGADTVAD
jgi:hypothetical protein